jgi:hypothetical protein
VMRAMTYPEQPYRCCTWRRPMTGCFPRLAKKSFLTSGRIPCSSQFLRLTYSCNENHSRPQALSWLSSSVSPLSPNAYRTFCLLLIESLLRGTLFESLGVETGERIVLHAVTDLDWVAANFTVFDVTLTANGQVENHRNLFPTIRATEGVFHWGIMVRRVLGRIVKR